VRDSRFYEDLRTLSTFLAPEIRNDVIRAVNAILTASISDYSANFQLSGLFNGYDWQLIDPLLFKTNHFLEGEFSVRPI
jgi:hypothetical protein